ncbi:hypothetical protein PoB_005366000 [Plakobranchus ocellatus]|uniref:Uncharacterized protein n=1 Tax=Plakobranchus ocellatus TaxID=259542 RepID=A0AAV4C635_9GAST|nr:hypothetical protein PoB_005366000 [Plakobranchus ocellatus]
MLTLPASRHSRGSQRIPLIVLLTANSMGFRAEFFQRWFRNSGYLPNGILAQSWVQTCFRVQIYLTCFHTYKLCKLLCVSQDVKPQFKEN